MKIDPTKVPVCVKDFEEIASSRITPSAWDYYRSGADTEFTLRDNENAFLRYRFRPRVLRDVSDIDLSTRVLGCNVQMPVGISPTAMQQLASPRGELDTAKAAAKKGIVMTLSTLSTTSLEDVHKEYTGWRNAENGQMWFQLYIYKDRQATKDLVERAEKAGYGALVLTVDTPYLGNRRADARNKFEMPKGLKLGNFSASLAEGKADKDSWLLEYTQSLFDASLCWEDILWLRSITNLKILLKGIVTAEDAELAVHHGVDGIIVSNHGARQLDGAPATMDALSEVVSAVDGRIEVMMDGGVRTGADVVKALAMGAKAVFIGRPVLWGLAYKGCEGVEEVLSILTKEVRSTMGLVGASRVSEISKNMIAPSFSSRL